MQLLGRGDTAGAAANVVAGVLAVWGGFAAVSYWTGTPAAGPTQAGRALGPRAGPRV